jgi:hypothetical protein
VKKSNIEYRYIEGAGHYCFGASKAGAYKMVAEWIDVDNQMWHEPYHLYGTKFGEKLWSTG